MYAQDYGLLYPHRKLFRTNDCLDPRISDQGQVSEVLRMFSTEYLLVK